MQVLQIGQATVEHDMNSIKIEVPIKKDIKMLLPLGLIFVFWLHPSFSNALTSVFSGDFNLNFRDIIFIFLLLSGLYAVVVSASSFFFGKQIIEIDKNSIKITNTNRLFSSVKNFELKKAEQFRVDYKIDLDSKGNSIGESTPISFDEKGEVIEFCGDLEMDVNYKILDILKSKKWISESQFRKLKD